MGGLQTELDQVQTGYRSGLSEYANVSHELSVRFRSHQLVLPFFTAGESLAGIRVDEEMVMAGDRFIRARSREGPESSHTISSEHDLGIKINPARVRLPRVLRESPRSYGIYILLSVRD